MAVVQQRRKDIKSGQAFLQLNQFIKQKRLDQRDKKAHTQLKEQKNKSVFPGLPVKLHLEHFQIIFQPHESSRGIYGVIFKK